MPSPRPAPILWSVTRVGGGRRQHTTLYTSSSAAHLAAARARRSGRVAVVGAVSVVQP